MRIQSNIISVPRAKCAQIYLKITIGLPPEIDNCATQMHQNTDDTFPNDMLDLL